MHAIRAHRRATLLLGAAIQFVVLTALAMVAYAGGTTADPRSPGYAFTGNFLSDLGATQAWSGAPNHASSILFGIALGGLGIAFIAFAGAWRAFAFERGRAAAVGIGAQLFGTASGAAFLGVAVTPVNRALDLHNALVLAAFGLLLGYAACLTLVWWRNGASRGRLVASVAYLLVVCGYVASVAVAVRAGVWTEHGRILMVVSQKAIAGASMLYVAYLTLATRRQLQLPRR